MATPQEILVSVLADAAKLGTKPAIDDKNILARIDFVCRCPSNRACVRLVMSCMLAKMHDPKIDPRKPYTQIDTRGSFSGRVYDESFLGPFITHNHLPCNSTTAFLTPAFRNQNSTLTTDIVMEGKPPQAYSDTLQLLDDVYKKRVTAEQVLTDALRILLIMRDEKKARLELLVSSLKHGSQLLPLASDAIVTLLQQHLACKNSSRLPVLIVAAAYDAASDSLGERPVELKGHNSADEQTGAMGDVEVCFVSDGRVCTIYEMKSKRVTHGDVDRALQKIAERKPRIDNYIFITTDIIETPVAEYAANMYEQTAGTEVAILDCIGFVRHFLHLFHRLRARFLDRYQELVLQEPDSAVSQPLKEAFLSLRKAAETDE